MRGQSGNKAATITRTEIRLSGKLKVFPERVYKSQMHLPF